MDTDAAHPWDGFLVGSENALAFAAAQALARGEPVAAAPLVVHGPSGSGKSRLLAGLVAERLRRRPGAAVAHLDAAELIAPAGDAPPATRLDGVELLALDDLAALGRAPARLGELAGTLDALHAAGGVAVVTASEPPAAWPARWPARLVSRLRGGLVVGLRPPGPELLRRHALDRARAFGLALSPETLDALAAAGGFREVDGRLARLRLAARLGDETDAGDDPPAPTTTDPDAAIAAIARRVARRFGVRLADLRGPDRRAALVLPRHLAVYLARRHTGASFARLGRYFGRRDTRTIRHACAAAAARLQADPALAAAARSIGIVEKIPRDI
jgi:chromosomal replication initiator protein